IFGREVAPDLDVAEKAKARLPGDLLERLRDRLDLRVVGRHAEADEPPRRRQPLDHVDLDVVLRIEQMTGRIEPGRPGADDGDAQTHGAILKSASESSRSRSRRPTRRACRARPGTGVARL